MVEYFTNSILKQTVGDFDVLRRDVVRMQDFLYPQYNRYSDKPLLHPRIALFGHVMTANFEIDQTLTEHGVLFFDQAFTTVSGYPHLQKWLPGKHPKLPFVAVDFINEVFFYERELRKQFGEYKESFAQQFPEVWKSVLEHSFFELQDLSWLKEGGIDKGTLHKQGGIFYQVEKIEREFLLNFQ